MYHIIPHENTKLHENTVLRENTVLLENFILHENTNSVSIYNNTPLLHNIMPYKSTGCDFINDANNVILPGPMWGMHYNNNQIIYSHIEGLYNDKIVRFTSTVP